MARALFYLALIPLLISGVMRLLHVFYFSGTYCESKTSLIGKTVIVTGANTGIGKTTAMDMAQRGARVILACRSESRTLPALEEIRRVTGNDRVDFMPLDLSSFQSVRNFAAKFLETETRLDVLINNAGLISSNEPKLISASDGDDLEMTLTVNHLGPFLLTNLLLDVMKRSGPGGRIVNVASVLYNYANAAAFRDFDALKKDGTENYFESFNFGNVEDSLMQL